LKKQYSFYFDSDRCIKCKSCELACKQWKGVKAGTIRLRKVIEVTAGTFPEVTRKFHSLTCRHCAKAPCAAACPSGAISRRIEDGIVVVDSSQCIGCRSCFDACPFGAPEFDEDGTMRKCDMCLDRVAIGQKPICVATCPTQALKWGTLEELSDFATKKSARKVAMDDVPYFKKPYK
jgi:anaerobic dimethyl sulfoxide reductase subunit B